MADTLLNHALPIHQWVNLYDISSIEIGVPIAIENVGSQDVYLAVRGTEPPVGYDAYNIVKRDGDPLRNSPGDPGAWAFCYGEGGKVNIRPLT